MQWVCDKCSKAYAVQSDYKAHLKTCGTRSHSCDCGRVFFRVESFIEHQDACSMGRVIGSESQSLQQPAACLSRTASSPSPNSSDTIDYSRAPPTSNWPPLALSTPVPHTSTTDHDPKQQHFKTTYSHNLELQLSTTTTSNRQDHTSPKRDDHNHNHSIQLQLSIGSSDDKLDTSTSEQLRVAMAERAYAQEARQQAKKQIELAEQEFARAKQIRQQAEAELEKAMALKEHAFKQMNSTILQITCHACKKQFQATRS